MIPVFAGSTPEAMKKVKGTFSWNSGVVLAINLQERAANFIMNAFFGEWGNAVFGLALRLVSYIRMATLGLTFGLDSVSSRLSSSEDKSSMQAMFKHSTRMLSFIAFPAMVLVFVLAEPLLRLWVGRSTENPELTLPQAEILVKIMVLGLACRAVSDGWMKLFYGAGFIRRYAPYVLIGGLFNPVLSIAFILFLPEMWNYTGAAVAYSLIFLVVNMIIMPKVTARKVNLTLNEIVRPIYRPLGVAIATSPSLLVGHYFSATEIYDWRGVVASVICYGITFIIGSWLFILTKHERSGVIRLVRQLASR
jgi:O-antigen/teichoic acid export membrane protein